MGTGIGIDFGTSAIRVAAMANGRPQLITPKDGGPDLPAAVCRGNDGRYHVGREAKQLAAQGEATLIPDIREGLGMNSDDVARTMLEALLESVGIAGEKIDNVVVTVPTSFHPGERLALVRILTDLGFAKILLMSDAAAIAVACNDRPEQKGCQLVYDFGESGLSVTLMEVGDNIFETLAYVRDDTISGRAFNALLADRLADAFRWQTGIDLKHNSRGMQRLLLATEDARAALMRENEALVYLPYIAMPDSGPVHLQMTVRRADYEAMLPNLSERFRALTEQVLKDAKRKLSDCFRVLLNGGAWGLKPVRAALESMDLPPVRLVPNYSPALGAAIYARESKDAVVLDSTGWWLGIGLRDGVLQTVFEPGTALPVTQSQKLFNESPHITFPVLAWKQGQTAQNRRLGEVDIPGISPSTPTGRVEVTVDLKLDVNGVLEVSAKEATTGKALRVEVNGLLLTPQSRRKLKPPPEQPPEPPPETPLNADAQALKTFMLAVLPTMDNLEMAIRAGEGNPAAAAIVQGVRLTLKDLKESLRKLGLSEIPAEGAPFDPNLHEAVEHRAGGRSGYVMAVARRGYRLNGRVIRYARVVVSK